MSDCLFCKIVNKEIHSSIIYEDNFLIAFNDINPQAPVHFLIIPKEHIDSVIDIDENNSAIVGRIFETIVKITKEKNLTDGYRIVINSGEKAGQSVKHLHFHILSGKQLSPTFD